MKPSDLHGADYGEKAIGLAQREVQRNSVLLLFIAISLYLTVLAHHDTVFGAIALALLPFFLIGLAMHAGHNAVHGAFAAGKRSNDLGMLAIDWVGVNGRLWQLRHLEHHKYPNDSRFDPDLDGGGLLDLGPSRPRPLLGVGQASLCLIAYLLVLLKLQIGDDVKFIGEGRVGSKDLSGQRCGLVVRSCVGKAVFFTWALIVPLFLLPVGEALVGFCYCYAAMGLILSLIFQVAHCNTRVQHGTFTSDQNGGYFRVQTCSTANFRVNSKLMSWYLAGLNLQVEHHIYPSLPNPLLRQKKESLRQSCDGNRGEYIEFATYLDAFRDHLKFLHKGATRAAR